MNSFWYFDELYLIKGTKKYSFGREDFLDLVTRVCDVILTKPRNDEVSFCSLNSFFSLLALYQRCAYFIWKSSKVLSLLRTFF